MSEDQEEVAAEADTGIPKNAKNAISPPPPPPSVGDSAAAEMKMFCWILRGAVEYTNWFITHFLLRLLMRCPLPPHEYLGCILISVFVVSGLIFVVNRARTTLLTSITTFILGWGFIFAAVCNFTSSFDLPVDLADIIHAATIAFFSFVAVAVR